ncbi:MAG: DsbA family protein [Myxococcales bacterium]|nr:DsbA family protein [Myxococcales bacterium]
MNREVPMLQLDDVERLSRFRARELSEDEARALELELSNDPELAQALARLERLDEVVSEHAAISPEDARAANAAMPSRSTRSRWLVPAALVAVAAAAAFIVLARAPDEPTPTVTMPRLLSTGDVLTAGVATLRAEFAGGQLIVAPFSHVIIEDGSTVRLASGSVLVRGTARVLADQLSAIVDGTLVVSTEPSRALADVTVLHPMNAGDTVMMKSWQEQAKSWAQTGLVVLVLTGSAQVNAADVREVLSPGQAWVSKQPIALAAEQPEPAPVVEVVKATAPLTEKTPKPFEMVDVARINAGVMKHETALMKCLTGRPVGDHGQVVALLTLAVDDGHTRLAEATVSPEVPFDPLVASCVLGVLQRVDFPPPVGTDLVQLKYPIEFTKRGEGSYLLSLPAPPGGQKTGLLPARSDVVDVRVGSSPSVGPADAKVTVVLFTEIECPFCARSHDTMKRLQRWAANKPVRFVYKHLPLESHPFARDAALRLIAAHEQGRFWDFLERAREQRARTKDALENVALGLTLDLPRYHAAVTSPATESLLQVDLDEAKRIGAKAVPTWYVNGTEFVGALPDAALMNAISDALKR